MTNLISLQKIFQNQIFTVPDYQRGYSWETEHRQDLLDDLESIDLKSEKHHYTGTIIVHSKEKKPEQIFGIAYKKFDIVDGQQRITTAVILLFSIFQKLMKIDTPNSKKYADRISDNYIKVLSQRGDYYKLNLNPDTDFFFKQYIIDNAPHIGEPTQKSHQNLLNAKKEFESYLGKVEKKKSETDFFDFIEQLLNKITNKLMVNFYEVGDEAEVGVIFEVMNDRGKPLSQLEKVKNYLIYLTYKVSSSVHDSTQLVGKINDAWKTIFQNLMDAGRVSTGDEDQLLRFHWIIGYDPDPRNYDIHKSIKKEISMKKLKSQQCYRSISKYISSLKEASLVYRDLFNPESDKSFYGFDDKKRNEIISLTNRINRLGQQATVFPLLMSARIKLKKDPDSFLKIIQLSEVFIFRVYTLSGYRSNAGINRSYRIANELHKSKKLSIDDVLNNIKSWIKQYANDDDYVMKSLTEEDYDYYTWRGIKYFLYEYERYNVESMNASMKLNWNELQKKDVKKNY
ncbi:MAG TPA: DUF262 domain-containing protein [Candidatus Marinimicrobia bacterium]|jgi:uncharacterized protein with ParB-like and HNH nuclease domain|nr:DUF262 domain-containing protein [Candidatus Neomarinimicrobiota bacterium]MDP6260702.1 DUF262 domain-containing protein [Candidatus Neomarinimicrobiota bacterium]MDP7128318.1 DUF262 domain-containing protein [Candidatus Neomarinimicrobiota bacterium]MDP7337655.1 DUF262 domain-containing protein [Candidatus Neomarinimicrobiota bacterium]MDP7474447.1 DUF262 domain-containing protein [Candidatus Neomarinimicrobiota bacterium]|tara:strand:- start:1151 stop:2686 length:1536 start_codon:yes stop_codon:yes gene_type:complete